MAHDTRYAYAVGKIRMLETRFLDKSRFDNLIDARDAEEAVRTLSDTDYGSFLSELKDVRDFETALNGELKNVLCLISNLSQDAELTDIFRLRHDFHNLKALLKIKYLGSRPLNTGHPPLMDAGLIEPEKLRKIIEEDNYKELPRELRAATEKAIKIFEETHNARRIDTVIDREMYILFSQRIGNHDQPFLREYFRIHVDLTNIKTLLRGRESGIDRSFFEEVFLEGGGLEKSLFLKSYEESRDNFVPLFSSTPYETVVSEGTRYRQENRSWSELERLSDNYLLSFLRQAKYIIFGLEPVIAYLLAKENEIKMLRMIMVGKLNGLPADLLRSRLRELY